MAYGHGHCTGTKKEKKGATDWYRTIEEANIRKVEAEWAQQQAAPAAVRKEQAA